MLREEQARSAANAKEAATTEMELRSRIAEIEATQSARCTEAVQRSPPAHPHPLSTHTRAQASNAAISKANARLKTANDQLDAEKVAHTQHCQISPYAQNERPNYDPRQP